MTIIKIFNYCNYYISFLNKWKNVTCFMAIGFLNDHVVKFWPRIEIQC
jgi:hypothetical protein